MCIRDSPRVIASGVNSIAIGMQSQTEGESGVALGAGTRANGQYGVAVGLSLIHILRK